MNISTLWEVLPNTIYLALFAPQVNEFVGQSNPTHDRMIVDIILAPCDIHQLSTYSLCSQA